MWLPLLVTMHIIIASVNSEIPTLEFVIQPGGRCDTKLTIILEDQPLKISVKTNDVYQIDEISCNSYDNVCELKTILWSIFQDKYRNTFRDVHQVPNCGRNWICKLSNRHNIMYECDVNFHYRKKEPTAVIALNGYDVNASISNQLSEYDALAEYRFEDGETVFIDCLSSEWVMLKYQIGERPISTEYVHKKIRVILNLTKNDHRTFIECYSGDSNYTFVTRLNFYMRNQQSITDLYINNMKIRPYRDTYYYVYNAGEEIDIACSTNHDDMYVEMEYYGNVYSNLTSKITRHWYLKKEHDQSQLECIAIDRKTISDRKGQLRIKFILSLSDFYVTGLRSSQILQEYQMNRNSVIHYEYTNNEKLLLTCANVINKPFDFSAQLMFFSYDGPITTRQKKTDEYPKYIIFHEFKLNANYANTEIICQRRVNEASTNITIKLLYKTPAIPDNDEPNRDNVKSTTEKNNDKDHTDRYDKITTVIPDKTTDKDNTHDINTTKSPHDDKEIKDNKIENWVWYICGAGILFNIVLIICIAYVCRHKRKQFQSSNVDTRNLLNSGENSFVEGRQENFAQYQNIMETNPYYEESVHQYAEILPIDNAGAVKPDGPLYAVAQRVLRPRNNKDYVNSRHTARYVNGQVVNELIEPAYCEVILANK